MKLSKLLVAVFALLALVTGVGTAQTGEVQDEYFQKMQRSVYKDFGACIDFYKTQYDYIGWARWNDGAYIVIFQNERPSAVKNGLWGGAGPGISFENMKESWGRHVHSLAVPMPGWGFGISRGKDRGWVFDIIPTNRASLNPKDPRFHPSGCIP